MDNFPTSQRKTMEILKSYLTLIFKKHPNNKTIDIRFPHVRKTNTLLSFVLISILLMWHSLAGPDVAHHRK